MPTPMTETEIADLVRALLQPCEELGSPEGTDYVRVMLAVAREALARVKVFEEAAGK